MPAEAPPNLGMVVAALLSLYVIWGSTYFGIRVALQGFPPLLMAGVRFLLAGGILYGVLRLRGTPRPTGAQWLRGAAVGLLLVACGNGCVVFAQQWVASSLAAVMVASMPLFAALFSGLWGRWPRVREWAGLLLGTSGVVLLNLEGGLRANPLGALLLLLAPVAWAFGSLWSRQPNPHMPRGLIASAMQMLAGGAVMFVLGLLRGERMPEAPGLAPVMAVAYLVVFGSLVAYSAYGFLLRHVRPTLATSYAYVNPVVALAIGTGLGGERVGVAGLVGTGVILAGVALVALGRARD
ncbi:MAG: drug/metabolite exporter YedA [Myxococcaceae bacterium]|nr:drug/metabolite exporter YedA [Myxococcaceae bacterium]